MPKTPEVDPLPVSPESDQSILDSLRVKNIGILRSGGLTPESFFAEVQSDRRSMPETPFVLTVDKKFIHVQLGFYTSHKSKTGRAIVVIVINQESHGKYIETLQEVLAGGGNREVRVILNTHHPKPVRRWGD